MNNILETNLNLTHAPISIKDFNRIKKASVLDSGSWHEKESLDKAQRFVGGRGAWMGFFAFLPILGSAITILLGLMKANIVISITSISIGKFLRYLLLVYGASFVI